MSQLNLKQILSGDDVSVVIDKLNYNFNQIVLNGGGPQGLRGIMGAPGLPGAQGLQGLTGPRGETGTHLYGADGASPGAYPFGTGGEILPRKDDLFIEANPTFLVIWQLAPTGASGTFWKKLKTIEAPATGLSKLIYDNSLYGPVGNGTTGASATWTSAANNPAIAGKMLLGSAEALYKTAPNFILQVPGNGITSSVSRLRPELSAPSQYADSMMTIASRKNQLRIIDSSRVNVPGNDILLTDGGIVHTLETGVGNRSVYKILNADSNGNKHFVLRLNQNTLSTGRPTLMYADDSNKLGIGVAEFTSLIAGAVINGSFAVGSISSNFYLASNGANLGTVPSGGIIEGNVSIGKNNNRFATLGIYNRNPGAPGGNYGASLRIDTDITGATSSSTSDIFLGGSMYTKDLNPAAASNYWRIRHDSFTGSQDYRKLTIFGAQTGLTGTNTTGFRQSVAIGLTASGSNVATQFHIDSNDLYDMFEVAGSVSTTSIGIASGGPSESYMSAHWGINLSRSPVTNRWRRSSDGFNNAGRTFWTSSFSGLALSLFPSTGSANFTNITDNQVYNATRFYFGVGSPTGPEFSNFVISETSPANIFSGTPGLLVDTIVNGTTGTGNTSNRYRRIVANFGEGVGSAVRSNYTTFKKGSPMLMATNGIDQSTATGHVYGSQIRFVPQYSWNYNDLSGLFLAAGATVNRIGDDFGVRVGLTTDGWAGLTITGSPWNGRVGIGNPDPYELLQVGEKLVFHDGGFKHFGYNTYFDVNSSSLKRIAGSTAVGATMQGAFQIGFGENNRAVSTATAPLGTLTKYTNLGTSLYLIPHGVGGNTAALASPTVGKNYRGFIFSNPPVGPTSSWNNLSSSVPQLLVGLTEDEGINTFVSARRGTLAIASQFRIKPAASAQPATGPFGITIEDQYNIGLYNYTGFPVAGIFTQGGNFAGSTAKVFGINFLGEGGNAIAGDVPFLYGSTDAGLGSSFRRTANFGTGFRLGVNIVPRAQLQAYTAGGDPIYDYAALVVGGYAEGLPEGTETAIISKGSLVIDQSIYSGGNGGNMSLVWKDNTISTNSASRGSVEDYYGDWGIQYSKFSNTQAGLNFWKPFGSIGAAAASNNLLYLSDDGWIGINTATPVNVGSTVGRFIVSGSTYISNGLYVEGGVSGYNRTGFPGTGKWFSTVNILSNVAGSSAIFGSSATARTYSIRGANDIWTGGLFVAASDNRIKNIVKIPETSESLDIIKKIQVTDYTYIDSIKNPGIHRKLIAQNVKECLPSAVSERDEFIPNLYMFSKNVEKNSGICTIEVDDLKDLAIGDILRLVIDEKDTILAVKVISLDNDSNKFSFSIDSESSIGDKVFVYGKQVEDFLTLDYDSISCTHIAATQELVKIIDSQSEIIKNLENKLSKIEELLAKNGIK